MGGLVAGVAIEPADVRAAVDGDHAAFTRIVEAHHPEMARLAYLITGDATLAQDAVQSAWQAAWQKLATVREPSRLRSWLLTIAANEARQAARRSRRWPVTEIRLDAEAPPRSDPALETDRLDLASALARLPPDDRALLALRYFAGFESGEIGALTGRSAAATRTRLSRLVARLRKDLRDD